MSFSHNSAFEGASTPTTTKTTTPTIKAMSTPLNYAQDDFLPRMRFLLSGPGSDLDEIIGDCHGLGLVWLYYMARSIPDRFYAAYKYLVRAKETDLLRLTNAEDERQFVARIEFAQNPHRYSLDAVSQPTLLQKDVDIILARLPSIQWCNRGSKNISLITDPTDLLEVTGHVYAMTLYTRNALINSIKNTKTQNINTLVIGSVGDAAHTMVVYYNDGFYYVFNANNIDGEANPLLSAEQAVDDVLTGLYTSFNLPIEPQFTLETNVLKVEYKPMPKPSPKFDPLFEIKNLLDLSDSSSDSSTEQEDTDRKIKHAQCLFGAPPKDQTLSKRALPANDDIITKNDEVDILPKSKRSR